MNTRLRVILSTFKKQENRNDCGLACLISICRFSGINFEVSFTADEQVSLLTLQKLALNAGLVADCVRMDVGALMELVTPCILLVSNENGDPHFIVHYPQVNNHQFHLIGDPARGVVWVEREALLQHWGSGAALYFAELPVFNQFRYQLLPWNYFSRFKCVPVGFWLSIPFLNVMAVLLGMSGSLLIQRLVRPEVLNGRNGFFVVLFTLLLMLFLAKGLLGKLQHRILAIFLVTMDERLSQRYSARSFELIRNSGKNPALAMVTTVAEKHKVHEGIISLIGGLLSDSVLVFVMLALLFFYQPWLGAFEVVVSLLMLYATHQFLPWSLVRMEDSSSNAELRDHLFSRHESVDDEFRSFAVIYQKACSSLIAKSKYIASGFNRITTIFEILGGLSLFGILLFAVIQLRYNQVSYEEFLMVVLIAYGLKILMTKICNQVFIIAQAALSLDLLNSSPQ